MTQITERRKSYRKNYKLPSYN